MRLQEAEFSFEFSTKDRWETLCRQCDSVLNREHFLSTMERVYGVKAMPLIAQGPKGTTGVPCYQVRSIRGRRLTSSPFAFHPPLIGVKDETTAVAAMIKAAEVLGMGHAVEYKSHGGLASGVVDALGIRPGPSPVLSTLSLEPDFQSQTMRFGKSRRRGLRTRSRRAEEQSIALSITDEPSRDVLAEWYDLHVRLYRDKHLMITQPFELFEHLLCRPCFRGMGRLVLAKVGKRIIGGIVVLVSGDLWEYSWAAYDRRYARVAVNSLLINFAIKTAIEEGARVFSFGASDPRNHDLVSFKASWGCYSKPVNYYYWNCYPPRNRGLRAGQRVVNVLPCWTLRRLSKVAARWLV